MQMITEAFAARWHQLSETERTAYREGIVEQLGTRTAGGMVGRNSSLHWSVWERTYGIVASLDVMLSL